MLQLGIQLAVIALLLSGNSNLLAACANGPSEVARDFFLKHYFFLSEDVPAASLSPDLANLVARELACRTQGQVCSVHWDFWTGAQDGEVDPGVRTSALVERNGMAKVELRYTFRLAPTSKAKPLRAEVLLLRDSDGCWKVDDILRARQSVKRLLAAAPSPN